MTIRATTLDVLTRTRDALRAEAQAAAGNTLLSKAEQDALAPSLLKDAAVAVRAQGGSGARVEVDALVQEAARNLEALLGGGQHPRAERGVAGGGARAARRQR